MYVIKNSKITHKIILLLVLIMISYRVFSHQPVLNEFESSEVNPYVIMKPEVSKAIFASLNGYPHYYQIESPVSFRFYAGITTPKIDNCDAYNRFAFSIYDENMTLIADFNDERIEWWPWYEEYGKKWYWIGPEFGKDFKSTNTFDAGKYYIKVYNKMNAGNYVLAVGDDEKFTPLVIMKLIFKLPRINKKFWDDIDCLSIGHDK